MFSNCSATMCFIKQWKMAPPVWTRDMCFARSTKWTLAMPRNCCSALEMARTCWLSRSATFGGVLDEFFYFFVQNNYILFLFFFTASDALSRHFWNWINNLNEDSKINFLGMVLLLMSISISAVCCPLLLEELRLLICHQQPLHSLETITTLVAWAWNRFLHSHQNTSRSLDILPHQRHHALPLLRSRMSTLRTMHPHIPMHLHMPDGPMPRWCRRATVTMHHFLHLFDPSSFQEDWCLMLQPIPSLLFRETLNILVSHLPSSSSSSMAMRVMVDKWCRMGRRMISVILLNINNQVFPPLCNALFVFW